MSLKWWLEYNCVSAPSGKEQSCAPSLSLLPCVCSFQLLTFNLFTCKWRWPRPLSGFQFNTWQIKWLRQAWGWITSLLWQIHISNRTRIIHILCMESKSSSLAITDKWAYTGIVANFILFINFSVVKYFFPLFHFIALFTNDTRNTFRHFIRLYALLRWTSFPSTWFFTIVKRSSKFLDKIKIMDSSS